MTAEPAATGTETELRSLDPRVVRLWRLHLGGAAAAAAVAGTLAATQWLGPEAAAAIALAVGAVGAAVVARLPPARFRRWRYAVRSADLLVRQGVFWRMVSVVPHARIQHVDTRGGPLERRLGLARVVVHTAGMRGAAVAIPGLARGEAERLRDHLAALGGRDDAV